MILVSYVHIAAYLSRARFNQLLHKLPLSLATKALHYRQWQDRYLSVFGKLLLLQSMTQFGIDTSSMARLVYNEYGKPSLQDDSIQFNISHAGHYVVCAMSDESPIGIDIEQVRPIGFDDFSNTMTASQWNQIEAAEDRVKAFYRYWTCKESVLKADARGLSIPLTDIFIENEQAICRGKKWFITPLALDDRYMACMATAVSPGQVRINCLQYDDL